MKKIAIIGLGYVGLPLAVEFAKKRPVVGFDIKPDRIKELNEGHDPTLEVSDKDLMDVLQPIANSQQPTANSQRPTANSQRPTANSQQPTANSQRPLHYE